MTGPTVAPVSAGNGTDRSSAESLRGRRPGRWIAIVAASLFIHLTLFDLLPRWSLAPADDAPDDTPLQVRLMPAIQPVEVPVEVPVEQRVLPHVPPPKQAPAPRLRPRPPRPAEPLFVPESVEAVPQIALAAPEPAQRSAAVAAAPPVVARPAPTPSEPPQPTPVPQAVASPAVAASVPQSARLSYRVVSLDAKNAEPTHYYGVGTIDWTIEGNRYRSELQAAYKALFIKVAILALHSEGSVGPAGLAPDRYTETPWRRAAVATNFNRDTRQSITFSSSQASVPLVAGAQDRLSILFQIGGLLLANPRQADTGGRIDVPVAGVRGEVETWTFESHGIERLDTGAGALSTTHLRRSPRPGTNDRTIDVWIAQDDGGYPAKVLYTEPNGSTIEMLLDRIGTLATDGADGAERPAP